MNQDFGLSLTPAIARRLCLFEDTCNIVIPKELKELAQQDKINESHFDSIICPASEVRLLITQFLLDCNLRGIVQNAYHPTFDETALANTIRLGKPKMIRVCCNSARRSLWMNIFKSFYLDDVTEVYSSMLSSEQIDASRGDVLVCDLSDFNIGLDSKRALALEISKTIYFDKTPLNKLLIPWTILASHMFPTMPSPTFPYVVKYVSQKYAQTPLHKFARLYNTCIFEELIISPDILKELRNSAFFSKLNLPW